MNRRFLQVVILRGAVVAALTYLILPLLIILPVSLTDQRMLALPVNGLSLQHYAAVIQSEEWLSSTWQSLVIGIASTVLAVVIGVASAIGCKLVDSGRAGLVRILNLLPIVIPSIIYALGAYRFYVEVALLDTMAGVILAHAVGAIPFVFIAASASLEQLDLSLVRAAQSLGAGMIRTAIFVLVPNMKAGIVSGAIFAFLHSWDEIVVTLFISSRTVHTLPRKMWEGLNENLDPVIACVAVALLLFTLILLLIEQKVKRMPPAG